LKPEIATELADSPRELARLAKAVREATTLRGDLRGFFSLTDKPSFGQWLPKVSPRFRWDWPHLRLIQHVCDLVTVGALDRVIISMPPRHGKSECVTVRYPVYRMLCEPSFPVIVASYSASLAKAFSRSARSLATREAVLSKELAQVAEWKLTNGSVYRAVGVNGGVVGRGAKLVIIDDPIKSRKQAESSAYRAGLKHWYQNEIYTRLEPDAAVIVIQTRWHDDDLAGHLLTDETGDTFTEINLPALAYAENDLLGRGIGDALCPERYDLRALKRIASVVKKRVFNAQYQGRPMKAGGNVFAEKWWATQATRFSPAQMREVRAQSIGRWLSFDTAYSEDESASYSAVCCGDMLPDFRLRLTDVRRDHLSFPDLVAWATRIIQEHNRDGKLKEIAIEWKASGRSLHQTLERQLPPHLAELLVGVTPQGSKEDRANASSYWCENGSILLPYPGMSVPWLAPFFDELLKFPAAERDDQVDSFTQLLDRVVLWLERGLEARMRGG